MNKKVLVASVVLSVGLVFAGAAFAADEPAAGAPAPSVAKGKAVFEKYCNMCHEHDVVTVQRHSRAAWTEVLIRMREMGLEATQRELNDVLDYLAVTYPEE